MARLFEQYAVVETNHIAAVRNGRIKAQYKMKNGADVENGMLLVVDDAAQEVKFSADGKEKNIQLHASEERMYEDHLGRKGFILKGETQMPKMLALQEGDIFETNAVDGGDFLNLAAVKAADVVYGIAGQDGLIELKNDTLVLADYAVVLEMVKVVDLPNETEGIKFTVIKA